jgi:DNA-binding winged helix-turn-helix (wHTH) protein
MRWDDFTRVGAPEVFGPAAQGLALGLDRFPPALHQALSQAGLLVEDVAEHAGLPSLFHARKPDFLICAAQSTDPEAIETLLRSRPGATCPFILVTEARTLPESAPKGTVFSELLGMEQDALGYFLLLRATLRRKLPHVMTDRLCCGALSLDQEKFRLSLGGQETTLSKLELCVIGAMMDAPRMVWSKVFLNRVVFGPVSFKPGRQFDTYMSRVRRGIRDRLGSDPIVAEHRIGYALSPAVVGAAGLPDEPPGAPAAGTG